MLLNDLILDPIKVDLQRKLDVLLPCHEFQGTTLFFVCIPRKSVELRSQDMPLDKIIEIWLRAQLLELPKIARHLNLFEVGGLL